jgi:hypothetical protein
MSTGEGQVPTDKQHILRPGTIPSAAGMKSHFSFSAWNASNDDDRLTNMLLPPPMLCLGSATRAFSVLQASPFKVTGRRCLDRIVHAS